MRAPVKRLRRFFKYWSLSLEAAVLLLLTRLALKVVSFERLSWFFTRPTRKTEITGEQRERIKQEIQSAIWRMVKALPGEIVCFPRAITVQSMLRRRGISTVLYYGAITRPETGLETHAWVQDGDQGVMGYRAAQGYHVLARYPSMD